MTQYTFEITFTGDPGFVASVPQANGPASSEALLLRTFVLSFNFGLPRPSFSVFLFFFFCNWLLFVLIKNLKKKKERKVQVSSADKWYVKRVLLFGVLVGRRDSCPRFHSLNLFTFFFLKRACNSIEEETINTPKKQDSKDKQEDYQTRHDFEGG